MVFGNVGVGNPVNYWLIKTPSGYTLQDEVGNYLKYFVMACDSKAWVMGENISYTYLTKKSDVDTIATYKRATGKSLWFE